MPLINLPENSVVTVQCNGENLIQNIGVDCIVKYTNTLPFVNEEAILLPYGGVLDTTETLYFKSTGGSGQIYTRVLVDNNLSVGNADTLDGLDSTDFALTSHNHQISDVTNLQSSLDLKADLVTGKVPASQLPSYVDDVLEYATEGDFPAQGESGKLYVAIDVNKSFRWTGTQYVDVGGGVALGETSSTAYRGDRGKTAYDHSQLVSGNPHNVTKSDVGLGNVDNTSDTDKPISDATAAALAGKENTSNKGQANGYAELDANAKVPTSQLPDSATSGVSKLSELEIDADKDWNNKKLTNISNINIGNNDSAILVAKIHSIIPAEAPDVTFGNTATSNTEYSSTYSADKAIDDDINTRWQNADGDALPHWLQIDFGDLNQKIITSYTIRNEVSSDYGPTDWELQGSYDATNWDTLDTQSGQTLNSGIKYTYSFTNNKSYRYYRLYVTANGGTATAINEFELLENPYGNRQTGTATANSEFDASYAASKAIDGDISTVWTTARYAIPAWIQLDLGSPVVCKRYGLGHYAPSNHNYHPKDWEFQGSNDGSNWDTLDTRSVTTPDTTHSRFYISLNNTAYRYYRLYITSSVDGNGYIDLAEFYLYETTTGIPDSTLNVNNGKVYIGTDNPVEKLTVGEAGDGTNAIANSWLTFSDKRYKENIKELDNALEKVSLIKGVSYNWKKSGKADIGFIAQDVQKVIPAVVQGNEYLSIDYPKLSVYLVEAIKELIHWNKKLENEIEDLDKKKSNKRVKKG